MRRLLVHFPQGSLAAEIAAVIGEVLELAKMLEHECPVCWSVGRERAGDGVADIGPSPRMESEGRFGMLDLPPMIKFFLARGSRFPQSGELRDAGAALAILPGPLVALHDRFCDEITGVADRCLGERGLDRRPLVQIIEPE